MSLDLINLRRGVILSAVLLLLPGQQVCTSGGRHLSAQKNEARRWIDISWTTRVSDNPAINDISFDTPQHGWALTRGAVFETNDGGTNWTKTLSGEDRRFFSAVHFIDSRSGWLVGSTLNLMVKGAKNKALILHTADGGKSWSEQPISASPELAAARVAGLLSISPCNSDVAWSVGENALVRTSNGGRTWVVQRIGPADEYLTDVVCVDPERALAVGSNGTILYTRDGGENWVRQKSGVTKHLLKVRRFDETFWIVGADGVILRARDDGSEWGPSPSVTTEALHEIYMHGDQGWIVGARGTILLTADRGLTWERYQSPTESDLISLSFVNPRRGWAGGSDVTLLRFSD